jgi:hypothetical protein
MSEARSHMPAWRAKGYLKISESGEVKAKITSWHDKEVMDQLVPAVVRIGDERKFVDVKSDYLLE